jgi:uncharacterized membrane protein
MREQRWYVFSLSSQPLARIVVTADFFLTATAVIAQPITGSLLALQAGYSLREGWIVRSIGLYLFLASGCLDANALAGFGFGSGRQGRSTSGRVSRIFWHWCAFGVPAFVAVAIIFWLMVARPQITA